ncbi:unnamed protein product [Protopolystoma xenopodis]|uniref:Dynein regulatory complex subunit 7 C-terminal domain-containing protein n=1 Tax=Protopolystoma xenopodis TaxID=117903 RepID=A0A448WZQ1_9PLAT|nr:unnamed protein product [Protopolystoma xenopodis]
MNQVNLNKDDEVEYLQFCNEATFRITTLEAMLARHKQTAPQKYMALEKKLRFDPRLAEFLQAETIQILPDIKLVLFKWCTRSLRERQKLIRRWHLNILQADAIFIAGADDGRIHFDNSMELASS